MLRPLLAVLFTPVAAALAAPIPQYQFSPVPAEPEQVACSWSDDQLGLLEKINRCDRAKLLQQETIVIPKDWLDDELAYAPLPLQLEWAKQLPQLVVVHKPLQVFGAYEGGRLVRWGPVSTGAATSPTPNGLFSLNWKSKGHRSTVNRDWYLPWYFNFSNLTGHGLHEYALPGQPASHGCVRLLERDAQWIYGWGRQWKLDESGRSILEEGSPIVILGDYPHGEVPPWREPSLVESGFSLSRSGHWLSQSALELGAAKWSRIEIKQPLETID